MILDFDFYYLKIKTALHRGGTFVLKFDRNYNLSPEWRVSRVFLALAVWSQMSDMDSKQG